MRDRIVVLGLALSFCLVGCKSGSSPATDAALRDDSAAFEVLPAERPGPDGLPTEVLPAERPGPDGLATEAAESGCSGWTALKRLTPAEAKQLVDNSNPIVINVHVPYEGDIPGTDVDIPYNNVDAIEAYLKHDHCADLLLVCKSGGMSLTAGNELIRRGYLRVRDVDGGMLAWVAAGYTLLKDGGV